MPVVIPEIICYNKERDVSVGILIRIEENVMKTIGYVIFAWIYDLCCFFCRVHPGKIVLWNGHNHGVNGNLEEIRKAYQDKEGYVIRILVKRDLFRNPDTGVRKPLGALLGDVVLFFVIFPYHMATAEKVFMNDNFLPLCHMNTKKRQTQYIQLWHGAGAFKRFGLSTETDPSVAETVRKANRRITHLFVTSKHIAPYYEEAFAVSPDRIYPAGIPVTDIYFETEEMERRKEMFYKKYPELIGKKLLLYAPTFRRTDEENQNILKQFDILKIQEILGNDWVILIKMHPKFPAKNIMQNKFCYDMTNYNDITDLYLVSDMLITDYSSCVVEYVLLDKPILLFAYDLPEYDRGFYFDYESMMPGEIAHSQEELFQFLQKKCDNIPKRQNFVKFQYDNIKGNATRRILDILG